MIIQDLTGRDEPKSQVVINGFTYFFEMNEAGDKVAQVNSSEHVSWLIGSGNFKKYEPGKSVNEEEMRLEWEAWRDSWLRLGPTKFVGFDELEADANKDGQASYKFTPGIVYEQVDKFDSCPKDIYKQAVEKWNRQCHTLVESGELRSAPVWPGQVR